MTLRIETPHSIQIWGKCEFQHMENHMLALKVFIIIFLNFKNKLKNGSDAGSHTRMIYKLLW